MSELQKLKIQHYISIVFGTIGIIASLCIIGLVDHPQSGLVGVFGFCICLLMNFGSVVNYYINKKRLYQNSDSDTP